MNLKLETEFGTFAFDLEPVNVRRIIDDAVALAAEEKTKINDRIRENAEKLQKKEEEQEKTDSRGQIQTSSDEAHTFRKTERGAEDFAKTDDRPEFSEGYGGFLHIKCDGCGKTHTYCSKEKIRYSKCQCGHSTKLEDLRRAYVECKCGGKFRYFTNITEESFEISCFHCGSPIDMELNTRRNAFITTKDRIHRGGGASRNKDAGNNVPDLGFGLKIPDYRSKRSY